MFTIVSYQHKSLGYFGHWAHFSLAICCFIFLDFAYFKFYFVNYSFI